MSKPLFLDTAFAIALLDPHDELHKTAVALRSHLRTTEIWVTEAVLMELASALSKTKRSRESAVQFIEQCQRAANIHIVSVDNNLFARGLQLYKSRSDKTWSLVDCISFTVMEDNQLTQALSSDDDFTQAGYQALLKK